MPFSIVRFSTAGSPNARFALVALLAAAAGCGGSHTLDDGGGGPPDGGPAMDGSLLDAGLDACDAPGTTETVPCGSCGTTTRFCTAERIWAYGPCTGGGECSPGAERTATCGRCGTATERCSDTCTWDPPGECTDEGVCTPGSTSRSGEGCPAGQARDVLCNDACDFVPMGVCMDDSCSAPGTVESVACGARCGTTNRFCTAAGSWSYGPCEETGECTPGTSEAIACGRCGTRMARCTTTCMWDATTACTGEGVCAPGETSTTTEGCPAGESRMLTCGDACTFVPGPCIAPVCAPGAVDTVPCGMCGTRTRTCSEAGLWVDGPCGGEGECAPGTTGREPCGLCGTEAVRCDTTCSWVPTGACTGEITCGPPPASTCVDAATLRTYGGAPTCSAGACSYSPTDVRCGGTCSTGVCVGGTMLIGGLGGPAGFGAGVLPSNDDGSSSALPLGTTFPGGLNYYGTTHTTLFVNNNGNVSFGGPRTTYTPTFPGPAGGAALIAPFWGDVDTRGGGQPAANNVAWHMDATRTIVTWHRVGYFNTHTDRMNSVQLVLVPRSDVAPGDFDVEMRYERCEWTTGDASGGTGGLGGTPASAGFDAGNAVDFLELPGSGTMSVLALCSTSNIGVPGVWRFQVRGGVPR